MLIEPGILNGDSHLVGQRFQNSHIIDKDGLRGQAVNIHHAQHPLSHLERHAQFGSGFAQFREIVAVIWFGVRIVCQDFFAMLSGPTDQTFPQFNAVLSRNRPGEIARPGAHDQLIVFRFKHIQSNMVKAKGAGYQARGDFQGGLQIEHGDNFTAHFVDQRQLTGTLHQGSFSLLALMDIAKIDDNGTDVWIGQHVTKGTF